MKHTIYRFFLAAAVLVSAVSCHIKDDVVNIEMEHVAILYSAGFNNLSQDLNTNIRELTKGYVPSKKSSKALVVAVKSTEGSYALQTSPYIIWIYRQNGKVVMDTIQALPRGTVMAEAETMRTILGSIDKRFHAKSYGMIYSSHGTGWLPAGYYNNPSLYENGGGSSFSGRHSGRRPRLVIPYVEPEQEPGLPGVKSLGQEVTGSGATSTEMEIMDLAPAIPMKLDYLLIDACLMGGVETAYALRNTVGLIGFSPAEILQYGFDYTTMGEHLLKGSPDAWAVCDDYFKRYDNMSGSSRSATISLINCSSMEELAATCRSLFAKYDMHDVDYTNVQGYYRKNKRYFFDLYDMVREAGATESELAKLQAALDKCVIYKNATPSFLGEFDIDTYSGLSSYLPAAGTAFLDSYYKEFEWNTAAGLVK
ncbi:MAG: hypothetical protein J5520_06350 [Bacteroidales bacterium]|nr:hypothetical protein [Bacteroidales bacterium]